MEQPATLNPASVLADLNQQELFLLQAQLTWVWMSFAPEEYSGEMSYKARLPFKRFGTNASSPEVRKETLSALNRFGAFKIKENDSHSYRIIVHDPRFKEFLGLVRETVTQRRFEPVIGLRERAKPKIMLDDGIPWVYELVNTHTGRKHELFGDSLHTEVARCLQVNHPLGELVLYDELWDTEDGEDGELNPEIVKKHLASLRHGKNGELWQEAIRQAGVRLREIARDDLGVADYIIPYEIGLIRMT